MKDIWAPIRWGFGLTIGYYLAEGVNNAVGIVSEIGGLLLQ